MIRTTLRHAKIGILMMIGFVLALCILLGALILGAVAIEPICQIITSITGRP